jgi:hypothetical protein
MNEWALGAISLMVCAVSAAALRYGQHEPVGQYRDNGIRAVNSSVALGAPRSPPFHSSCGQNRITLDIEIK